MLAGVDEARVKLVGGKAAVLEEIVRRWPDAPIPKFTVHTDNPPTLSSTQIYRTSSELDLFGGCGLYNTVADVTRSHAGSAFERVMKYDNFDETAIQIFAESVGREVGGYAIISQEQRNPPLWVSIMEHPNKRGLYLINFAMGPSAETIDIITGKPIGKRGRVFGAVYDNGKIRFSKDDDDPSFKPRGFTELVEVFQKINSLGIIAEDWVSIMEAGFYYGDGVDVYQLTPLRKRHSEGSPFGRQATVFGGTETVTLPVVRIPKTIEVYDYIQDYESQLVGNEDFKRFLSDSTVDLASFLRLRKNASPVNAANIFALSYVQNVVEQMHPNGYIVLMDADATQIFDVAMTNAKAVIVYDYRDAATILNHGISRLIAKVPVVVVSQKTSERLAISGNARFQSDGSIYKLEKA